MKELGIFYARRLEDGKKDKRGAGGRGNIKLRRHDGTGAASAACSMVVERGATWQRSNDADQ